jgi:hypothetical protein
MLTCLLVYLHAYRATVAGVGFERREAMNVSAPAGLGRDGPMPHGW